MTLTRANAVPILKPNEVRPLLLEPTIAAAAASQVATTVYIDAPTMFLPRMSGIDVAEWLPEGQEIALDDVEFTGQSIEPKRLVGGAVLTKEAIEDTSPEASALVGQALAADLAVKLDETFFGAKGTNAERPAGLLDVTGITNIAGTTDLVGTFLDAMAAAESAGVSPSAWVAHPNTVTALTKGLAMFTGQPTLDITTAQRRVILGVPLVSSRHVAAGVVWGLHAPSNLIVVRTAAEVEADSSVFFLSFRTALRARLRAAFGFTRPDTIVKVTLP